MKFPEKVQRWFHDHLGWGYPKHGIEDFDGASCVSHCKFCDGKLLMDSNGDWFHA